MITLIVGVILIIVGVIVTLSWKRVARSGKASWNATPGFRKFKLPAWYNNGRSIGFGLAIIVMGGILTVLGAKSL